MIKIVPQFVKIFDDFGTELPRHDQGPDRHVARVVNYWYLIPGIPISIWLFIKLLRKFHAGRMGWDMFTLKMPIFGQLVEKNILARTTRTLGTLVASGVPILEALNITSETAGNAVFEHMLPENLRIDPRGRVDRQADEGILQVCFHPMAPFFWFFFIAGPIGCCST